MALTTRTGRYDGTTMGELVTERFNALMETLADWEDQSELWQERHGYVPQYVIDGTESALDSLEIFSDYWGFDC